MKMITDLQGNMVIPFSRMKQINKYLIFLVRADVCSHWKFSARSFSNYQKYKINMSEMINTSLHELIMFKTAN